MIRKLFYALLTLTAMSCQHREASHDTPLITVIKLNAAETLANMEEAKKYLEVDRAYAKFANDSLTAENAWREMVVFNHRLAQNRKFTNVFTYFDYNIREEIQDSKAQVIFEEKNKDAKIRRIIYHLENNGVEWKVIDIVHERAD